MTDDRIELAKAIESKKVKLCDYLTEYTLSDEAKGIIIAALRAEVGTPINVAEWYMEFSESELRRKHASGTDEDAPEHMRSQSFEGWAEMEGYIRGSVLRDYMNSERAK